MKHILIFSILVCLANAKVFSQQDPSSESLRKKYEHSDLHKETNKKMSTSKVYPDSIVLAPLHYINTFVELNATTLPFESFSIDVDIQTHIPDNYKFYISPLNGSINGMQFYGGIQTASDGTPIHGGTRQEIGRGGIFSRWMERKVAALKTDGYYASSDNEGDFISVRNKVKWDKGRYRIKIYKSGYIPGEPVLDTLPSKRLFFSWGEYEQSWVTMEVENLKTHIHYVVGSLAFPGKKLVLGKSVGFFLEQYGTVINFAHNKPVLDGSITNYKDLPVVRLSIQNMQLNGKPLVPKKVKTYYNLTHNTEQSKISMPIPLLSTSKYDAKAGTIDYEVGAFQSWHTPSSPSM